MELNQLNVDGCKLTWWMRGHGPAVLFIQGCGVQGSGWLPQIETLAEKYTCIWYDNRGMGLSQPLGAALSVDRMAQDTKAILQASGHARAHVVGHSLGGLVAQRFAIDNRSSTMSLALLCTFADGRQAAPLTMRMMMLGLGTVLGTKRMRRLAFLRLVTTPGAVTNPDALAARLGELFGHDLAEQPPVVKSQLAAMRATDVTEQLKTLRDLPTLIVNARHDPIAPPQCGLNILKVMPHASYVEFADASHALPVTHADQVNQMLDEHFCEVK
ncbi:MAG: alpha/beta hydrolase [Pirellulaceae bacterium]|nr:alpha/beta hydrolase [Pirellulaceae bacterium]